MKDMDLWRKIWKWKALECYKTFLWSCARERLLMNEKRVYKHLTNDDKCPVCQVATESILHVIRDCKVAADVWLKLAPSKH